MARRVVISGAGLLTSLGGDAEQQWQRLVAGDSGIASDSGEADSTLQSLALVEDALVPTRTATKATKLLVRSSRMAMAAAERAVCDAGIALEEISSERKGIYVGTGERDTDSARSFKPALRHTVGPDGGVDYRLLGNEGLRKVNPRYLLQGLPNASLCQLTIGYGIRGTNATIVEESPAGLHAIGRAFRAIRAGRIDVALVGSANCLVDSTTQAALHELGMLCDSPRAFRPFDVRRCGFVPGEAAAFIVLEALDQVASRDGRGYAEVLGFGRAADYTDRDSSATDGRGICASLSAALRDSEIAANDINHITAHGGATPSGDLTELNGIRSCFGTHTRALSLTATKPAIGNVSAAGDVADVFFTARMLGDQKIPPLLNHTASDPAVVPEIVSVTAANKPIDCAMTLSRSDLGSQSAALCLRRMPSL
jgi:3-oxoacyl-[acyl-carrier-protein] synthase II